jgi:predicted acetyltransferase
MKIRTLNANDAPQLERFLQDFFDAGETDIPGYFAAPEWPLSQAIERMAAWGRGEQLGEGWVPCTTHFLVVQDEIQGLCNFRHSLTEQLRNFGGHAGYAVRPSARGQAHATRLLEHAKDFGRSLGIDRLLMTCDPANIASVRVIQKCGGVLLDNLYRESRQRHVSRFWISLDVATP